MRVIKSTAILTPVKAYTDNDPLMQELTGATYEVMLPEDYLHTLNCICVFRVNGGNYKCYNDGKYVRFGAKRLTSDMWSQIINNFYLKPSYRQPYYFIHNYNTSDTMPTNPIKYDSNGNYVGGTDYDSDIKKDDSTQPVTTNYNVVYGTAKNLSDVKSSIVASSVSDNVTLSATTSDGDIMVYVKIQKDADKKVKQILLKGVGYDSPLIIKTLSEFNTDSQNVSEYETEGYTTYIGYANGFKSFGSAGQTISIEIG